MHHAEVVAHRVGEPYGSLVLAVTVTVIEVALIVTRMISGGAGTETLARDTVVAAVMITVNGILGLSLFVGSVRRGVPTFNGSSQFGRGWEDRGVAAADDPFSMLELLIGLPNVRVLSVDRVDGVLEIHLETAEPDRNSRRVSSPLPP